MLANLDSKLLRDQRRMKDQSLTVSLVMAGGLAMLIMSRSLPAGVRHARGRPV